MRFKLLILGTYRALIQLIAASTCIVSIFFGRTHRNIIAAQQKIGNMLNRDMNCRNFDALNFHERIGFTKAEFRNFHMFQVLYRNNSI